jgi:futalosine hydrolase
MHILLIAATPFEIQPTIDALKAVAQKEAPAAILIGGVGGISTTWSLMRQIGRDRPDLIIQAGIAGSLIDRKPGTVFVIDEEELADLGVWEEGEFRSLFDLRLAGANEFPFSNGRLTNPYPGLLELTGLEHARGMTVNEITTDVRRIARFQQNTKAVVESMEGGPLHYVCLRENIPFLQIRSISNVIGTRDKTKWDIPLAITRLNEELGALIRRLGSTAASIFESSNH